MISNTSNSLIYSGLYALFTIGISSPIHGQNPGKPAPLHKSQPNILWISTEDMSPHLGCYGDAVAKTPNLDKLASQGCRFTNVFTTAAMPGRNYYRHVSDFNRVHAHEDYFIPPVC
jgi:hypothetical protein